MPPQLRKLLACSSFPYADCLVPAATGELGAIWTNTHTHIHTCAPSHGKGGVTIASLLPFFVSPSLTGVCCDYLTGASSCSGSACAAGKHGPAGSTSAATATCSGSACAAGTYGQAGATSSSAATCTSCVAGTYSSAGASRVCLLRCPLFPARHNLETCV